MNYQEQIDNITGSLNNMLKNKEVVDEDIYRAISDLDELNQALNIDLVIGSLPSSSEVYELAHNKYPTKTRGGFYEGKRKGFIEGAELIMYKLNAHDR